MRTSGEKERKEKKINLIASNGLIKYSVSPSTEMQVPVLGCLVKNKSGIIAYVIVKVQSCIYPQNWIKCLNTHFSTAGAAAAAAAESAVETEDRWGCFHRASQTSQFFFFFQRIN